VFENNHVTDSKASGIQVVNAFAIIRSNTVKDSVPGQAGDDGYGIGALDSDRIIVEGNTVEGCRSAGIFINRSAGQILGNKVKGNKEGGILITSALPEFPLEVHNNQVDANTVAGIFLLTSNGHLQGNIVTNTVFSPTDQSGTGVVVFGQSNVTIEKDRYEANQQHGLLIAQNSTAKVSNTSFTDNKQFGMVVQCTNSTVEETKNEYTKNGQGDRTKCP
jgi:parallel beta-helix repeat protein